MKKLLTLTALVSLLSAPALAASSEWFTTDGAKLRLVSLPSADGKTIEAGLEIALDKGWKTYWRAPGASGLPPQITFDGSTNVAATRIDFPVPELFGSAKNLTAGYTKSVTFPIVVEPLFGNRPVTLKASGLLGICGEICVPVPFELSLTETGKGVTTPDVAATLLAAKSNAIQPSHDGQRVLSASYDQDQMRVLKVSAVVPAGTSKAALHVEGPSNWYLMPTKAKAISGDRAEFVVSLEGIPESADPTATELRLSLVADGVGVEQVLTPTR